MQRRQLGEILQLTGISYYSFEDKKFRTFYPTDIIKGALINAKTNSTLGDFVYPLSVEDTKKILDYAHRRHILNSEVVSVNPCDKDLHFSKEFGGTVRSMSHYETAWHFPWIRHAFDSERVESGCTCEKKVKNRDIRSVWSPIILEEWDIEKTDEKIYNWPSCPHLESLNFRLRDIGNVKVFGIDDKLDFMKPYVLSYLHTLEIAPEFPDYVRDGALTYFSSMFDGMKKQIDEMRSIHGLDEIKMYDDTKVKNYIVGELTSGFSPTKIDEVIKAVSY